MNTIAQQQVSDVKSIKENNEEIERKLKQLKVLYLHTQESQLNSMQDSKASHPTQDYGFVFHMVLVGDAGAGMTSLLGRFAYGTFTSDITVGTSEIRPDFLIRKFTVGDEAIKMLIWDAPRQQMYSSETMAPYRRKDAILVLFDVTSESQFNHLPDWFDEIARYAEPNAVKFVVGTQIDKGAERKVTYEMAAELCRRLGVQYFETSALTNEGVDLLFRTVMLTLAVRARELALKTQQKQIDKQQRSGSFGWWFRSKPVAVTKDRAMPVTIADADTPRSDKYFSLERTEDNPQNTNKSKWSIFNW